MRRNQKITAVSVFAGLVFAFQTLSATAQEQRPSETAPLLTLDQAVELATQNNLTLKIAGLEVKKANFDTAATKTKRLPVFNTYAFGSVLLTPLSFTIPAGALGSYSATGPIPPKDKPITTNSGTFTTYVVGQASQPLTQLYKVHLSVREQELSSEIDSEKYRATRQNVVTNVKQAYYAVLQSQSSLRSTEASVKQYEELDRVMLVRISQEAVLQSDSLEVKAKLAQEQYKLLQTSNDLQNRKETLNDLLDRDLETPFRTEEVPGISPEESDLKLAEKTALAQRPEIKEALLSVQLANYDRRLAKAQYIPDLSIAVHYISPFNVQFLPKNIASAGFEFTWDPFDWGQRKDQIGDKQAVLDQSRLQLKNTQSKVLLDVNNRFRKLQETRVLLSVTEAAQAAAKEKLREVTQKFGQQSVLLRDVLEQQAATASANNDYEQALLGFWTAKADFEKALGED